MNEIFKDVRGLWNTDLVYIFILCLCGHYLLPLSETEITIDLASPFDTKGEVFFAPSDSYSAAQRVAFKIKESTDFREYRITIPTAEVLNKIRFDLGTQPGEIRIRAIKITTDASSLYLQSEELSHQIIPLKQVTLNAVDNYIEIVSSGSDPHFEIALPAKLFKRYSAKILLKISLQIFAVFLLILFISTLRRKFSQSRPSPRMAVMVMCSISLLLAIIMVAGKFHRSSIELWNDYLPGSESPSSLVYGEPLSVRSDEWVVQTPWIMSQFSNQRALANENIGPIGTTLLTVVPVDHISILGQPKFWGAYFFDDERAFSWFWAYKVVGLYLALFLLIFSLTNSTFYSVIGALWIYSSSFTQWWFSSNFPEILLGFCMSVASLIWLLKSKRLASSVMFGVLFTISGLSTALHLYPAFIVPLFYIGLAITIGYIANSNFKEIRHSGGRKLLVIASALIAILLVGYAIYQDAGDTIELVTNTVYPGMRVSTGGGLGVYHYFSGLFEFWRISENEFPSRFGNASEAGSFILIWPLTISVSILLNKHLLRNWQLLSLLVICLVITFYVTLGFSPMVARITGFSFAPSGRAFMGLGIAGILLCILTAQKMELSDWDRATNRYEFALFILAASLLLSLGLMFSGLGEFYNRDRVIASVLVLSCLFIALTFGKRVLLALTIIIVSVPGLSINPIARGLTPLTDKQLFQNARAEQAFNQDPLWIIFGSGFISQAFVANGLNTVGGNKFVPDMDKMRLLDPGGNSSNIWNRYARIEFNAIESHLNSFQLLHADSYRVSINPCGEQLKDIGVTNVGSTTALDLGQFPCLTTNASTSPVNGIYLYTIHRD